MSANRRTDRINDQKSVAGVPGSTRTTGARHASRTDDHPYEQVEAIEVRPSDLGGLLKEISNSAAFGPR